MSRVPLLLDTCAVLWAAADELSPQAAEALSEAAHRGARTYVSPVSAWEIGLLARKGKFKSHLAPDKFFDRIMQAPGMTLAELSPSVLIASSFLPEFTQGDPADRIIAATARESGFTVMTRDRTLLDYGARGYLSVLAC